jgi:hypothetical protein
MSDLCPEAGSDIGAAHVESISIAVDQVLGEIGRQPSVVTWTRHGE